MKTKIILVAVLAVAAAAGCAHHGASGPQISDADFGRLRPGQTGPVEEARQYVASASDELARAKLRLQESRHEGDLAKADETVSTADAERGKAMSSMAEQSREPAQLERSRALQEQAQLQKSAADAHVAYANKLNEANQASVDAATKQVELANARLELAKLQALAQAGVPAATKYDIGKFQARVNDAQARFNDALQRARSLQGQALATQQRWQEAQRQLQARGGAVQTG